MKSLRASREASRARFMITNSYLRFRQIAFGMQTIDARRLNEANPTEFARALGEIEAERNTTPSTDGQRLKMLAQMEKWVSMLTADFRSVTRQFPDQIDAVAGQIQAIKNEYFVADARAHAIRQRILAERQVEPRETDDTILSRIMHVSSQDAPLSENPEVDLASIIKNLDTPLQLGAGADIVRDADINVPMPTNAVALVTPRRQQRDRGMVSYAAYTLSDNPFIQINATYESFAGDPTPDLLTINVVPRANIAIEESLRVEVEVEQLPPETDISIEYAGAAASSESRLTSLVSRFMRVNEAVLAETMNPTHPTRSTVVVGSNSEYRTEMEKALKKAQAQPRAWSDAVYVVNLAPGVEAHVLNQGEGRYLVGLFDEDGQSLYYDLENMTSEQYREIANNALSRASANANAMAERITAVPQDAELIENYDAIHDGVFTGAFTTYVKAESPESALKKAILQKINSRDPFRSGMSPYPTLVEALDAHREFDITRSANRRDMREGLRDDTGAEVESTFNPDDLEGLEELQTLGPIAYGTAEDVNSPENQRMIAKFVADFEEELKRIDREFPTAALREGRKDAAYREALKNWDANYYGNQWAGEASRKGAEIGIRAVHALLTRVIRRNLQALPRLVSEYSTNFDTLYNRLMSVGTAVEGYSGHIAPHLSLVAARVANIKAADSVRVDGIGDGLLASFAESHNPASLELTDGNETVTGVIRAAQPELAGSIGTSGQAVDVLITTNTEQRSLDELMQEVAPGGRLVITGNSEYHINLVRSLRFAKGDQSASGYEAMVRNSALSEGAVQERIRAFAEWRSFDRKVHGGIEFITDNEVAESRFDEQSGMVLVIENTPDYGQSETKKPYVLEEVSRNHERMFRNMERLRDTRRESSAASRQHAQDVMEAKRRAERATAQSLRTINTAVDKGLAMTPAIPHLRERVLAVGHRQAHRGIIPQGTHVGSFAELGAIAEMARDPRMATAQVLAIQNNVVEFSVLGSTRSAGDVNIPATEIDRMVPGAELKGYDVAVVINRPSGNVEITAEDEAMAKELAEKYPGLMYVVIKDSGKYSAITIGRKANGEIVTTPEQGHNAANEDPEGLTPPLPSWLEGADESTTREYLETVSDAIATMQQNTSKLWSGHIQTISRLVESDDNWVVLALMNADQTLADMVELPDVFSMSQEQVAASVERVRSEYGGTDIYMLAGSTEWIQDRTDFFTASGVGRYLAGSPNISGSYLVGGGQNYPGKFAQTFTPQGYERTGLTREAESRRADRVAAALPRRVGDLMGPIPQPGDAWNNASAMFRRTLIPPVISDKVLSAQEIKLLKRQLHLGASIVTTDSNWDPSVSDLETAKERFKEIWEQFERFETEDMPPLYGAGDPVHPAFAYLMHYVGQAAEGDLMLIPDAGTGALVAYGPHNNAFQVLTEADPALRESLITKLSVPEHILHEAPATALHQMAAPVEPDVVLLDVKRADEMWTSVNEALHALKDGGRLVIHVTPPSGNEGFKNEWRVNLAELTRYYTLRGAVSHEGHLVMVIDNMPPVDTLPAMRKIADPDEFVEAIDGMRRSEEGQATDVETIAEGELAEVEDEQLEAAVSEHEQRYADTENRAVTDTRTHREWVKETNEALRSAGFGDVDVGQFSSMVYNMLAQHMHLSGEARDTAFRETLSGFEPAEGWDMFLVRLSASSSSIDPDIAYNYKLYELFDMHRLDDGELDINSVLNTRTGEVKVAIAKAHAENTGDPINIIGEVVNDAKDAAILFQPYRSPGYEKSVVMFVNRDGEVIDTKGMSAFDGYGSPVINIDEIRRIMNSRIDIHGFWVAHNHPRYNAEFHDDAGRGENILMSNLQSEFGEAFRGAVVTDTGEYAYKVGNEPAENRQLLTEEDLGQDPSIDPTLDRDKHRVIGSSMGTAATPEQVARVARSFRNDLSKTENMVTFVFVGHMVDTPGGDARTQVVGMESHAGLENLSPEEIIEEIRMLNGKYGAMHTHVVVNNPTDPSLFGPGSAWDTVINHREAPKGERAGLITSIYADTSDRRFADINRRISNNIVVQGTPDAGIRALPLDASGTPGDTERARKHSKFAQFIMFHYLVQDKAINMEELGNYSQQLYGERLSENEIYDLADIAFREMLKYTGLDKVDGIGTENKFYMLDDTYQRLVGRYRPAGRNLRSEYTVQSIETPYAGPFNRWTTESRVSIPPLNRYLTMKGINAMRGEKIRMAAHNDLIERHAQDIGATVLYAQITPDGIERATDIPTSTYMYTGEADVREGIGRLFEEIDAVAPGGRIVMDISLNESSNSLIDNLKAHIEMSVSDRNAAWGMSASDQDYYHNIFTRLLKYDVKAAVRTSEGTAQIIVDKREPSESPIVLTREPDIRSKVDLYRKVQSSKVPVAKMYMRAPAQGATVKQTPVREPKNYEVSQEAREYEEDLSRTLGRDVGRQPKKNVGDTDTGKVITYEVESTARTNDENIQVIVSGLAGRVSAQDLEKLFNDAIDKSRFPGVTATAEVQSEPGGAPGQAGTRKKNYGRIYMSNQEAADDVLRQVNRTYLNGTELIMTVDPRPRPRPGDNVPTGDPDSMLAWDRLLRNPFIPQGLKDKWARVFDIEEDPVAGTMVRKEGASAPRKIYDWWKQNWAYRWGRVFSRPIDVIERWGNLGIKLSQRVQNAFYESMAMAGEGMHFVKSAYDDMYNDPDIKAYLDAGDTLQIENQRGYLPTWLKKVPGIEARIGTDKVERAYDKDGNLLTHNVGGAWITEVFVSNRPLLDAWVNAHFQTQSFIAMPPKEVRDKLAYHVGQIRAHFDRMDDRLIDANEQILTDRLAGSGSPDAYRSISVNQTIDEDELRAYAAELGISLPNNINIRVLPRRGNMNEWVITDGNREIYRVREFDPMTSVERIGRRDQALTGRQSDRSDKSLGLYGGWIGKTLIYEPEPREPIWSYREDAPFQLFAGRPRDLPMMVNWSAMDPYTPNTPKHEAFEEYLERFYNANLEANPAGWTYKDEAWTMPLAKAILERNFEAFHDMRFEALEGDSELIYPSAAYESEAVLGEYATRVAQRVSEIINYGQQADILKADLDALKDPENLNLSAGAKAIIKLRQALGHDDFVRGAKPFRYEGNLLVPFSFSGDNRFSTRPEFDHMTAADWDALIDNDIVAIVGEPGNQFYAWADPSLGLDTRRQRVGDETVEFEVPPNAMALVNMPALDINDNILAEVELGIERYEIAKAFVLEHHTWHPKLIEMGNLEQRLRMIASSDITERRRVEGAIEDHRDAFYAAVVAEQEKLRNPALRGLSLLQRIATGLFMRLSWAVQLGTFHNPAHRTGLWNLMKGVSDQVRNEGDRTRLRNIGALVTEMTEVIALQAQSVSQENLGFNQKLLGASKYWRWKGHGGGVGGWLQAFYRSGNWTPFAWMERNAIRGTAAMAGKHLTRDVLTRLLTNPPDYTAVQRAQDKYALTELNVTIEPILEKVLKLQPPQGGWTEENVNALTEIASVKEAQEIYASNPDLGAVVELTNRVMQVMPDYAHYQGSGMHTPEILRKHPFLSMMLLFQRVMVAQMSVMKRMISYGLKQAAMPAEMADSEMNALEKAGVISKEIGRKIPHVALGLTALLGSGFAATMMANLVRFRQPDEDDLEVSTWMMNSAVFGALTGFFESSSHYRGFIKQFAGPIAGLGQDLMDDFTGTAGFYLLRPPAVDFRPALDPDFWQRDETSDIGRAHQGGGGYRPPTGTSLQGVRVR